MKKILLCLILFLTIQLTGYSQSIIVEAESGTMNGTTKATSGGVTFVTSLDATDDSFTITVVAPAKGTYATVVRYNSQSKVQDLLLNGAFVSNISFPDSKGVWADLSIGGLMLKAGNNTVTIRKNWGWTDFDKFTFTPVPPHDYTITDASLINPNVDQKTKDVYAFLRSHYGKNIISGQTDYWTDLISIAGKTPVVRCFDMQNYSPHNPWYNWSPTDDGTVKSAIDWYNTTNNKGIVSFQWHWFSPSGGSLRTSTFEQTKTTFDIKRAVVTTNAEYTETIRDIDAIAVQLKRLSDAGIPVLWRPLHEAGEHFFWWAADKTACLQLWDIMYDRLTNYHKLNNLIWVWSTPSESWYPGNAKVDIFGFDSYPGAYAYGSQKSVFDQMFTTCAGKKLVAMTENGPIPDPNACIEDDAMWSYFSSWSDLVASQNTTTHIKEVYAHANVITLDEVTATPVTIPNFWNFTTDLEGWNSPVQMTTQVASGILTGTISNSDPQIVSPNNLAISASDYKFVVVSMKNNTASTSAELFWTTTTNTGFDGVKMVTVPITPNDTRQRYYIIDLSTNANWTGTIKQVRFDPVTNVTSGTVEIDFIKIVGSYQSALIAIPGTLEAENFNKGGQDNAYSDSDAINSGGAIRTSEGVDIQTTGDATGSYNVGWTAAGEWMEYLVSVSQTGTYTASVRAATWSDGTNLELYSDGALLKTIILTNSGGVQTYGNTVAQIKLTQGLHILKIKAVTSGINLNFISFTKYIPTITPYTQINGGTWTQTNTATLCAGGSVSFGPQPADGTWSWTGPNSFTANTRGIDFTNSTTAKSGTYTATYTDANGNTNTQAFTLTVNALPTASISTTTPLTFCQGGSVLLTSNTVASYKWFNATTQVGTAATYTATTAGSYTVEVTNTSGCKATSAATVVTVNALPTAAISTTTPLTFCQGGSVLLTSSTGASYKWFNGTTQVGTTATYTATTAGSYTVELTNALGCKATSAATVVTVNALPTATISTTTSTTFCQGGSVLLTSSTGASYKWFNGTTQVALTATYSATAAGSYTVELTNASGCKALSAATAVTVNDLPSATVTTADAINGQNNGSITFTFADNVSRSSIGFSKDNGSAYTSVADNSGSYTFSNLAFGTYQVWTRWGNTECPVSLGSFTIKNNITSSITNVDEANKSFKVFPNPATEIINVQVNNLDLGQKVILLDSRGQEVFHQKIDISDFTISVSNISAGIYVLKVGEKVQRVMIAK